MVGRLPRWIGGFLVGVVAGGLVWARGPGVAGERALRVAAAASLRYALEEVVAAFREAHRDVNVEVTYGASGNFYAQILNRAPLDLFLSADVEYPRQVMEQGLALPDSFFVYATGRLVLWVRRESPLEVEKAGMEVLRHPAVRHIAVANPRLAPYGRAAVEALRRAGLQGVVADRLVYGENVNQAAQFVESGAADVGILPLSMVVAPPMRGAGRFWVVPAELHPPIEHGGVILKWVREGEAAWAFRAFLLGERGQAILERHGFGRPGGAFRSKEARKTRSPRVGADRIES